MKEDLVYVKDGIQYRWVTYIERLTNVDGLKRFIGEFINEDGTKIRRIFLEDLIRGGIEYGDRASKRSGDKASEPHQENRGSEGYSVFA